MKSLPAILVIGLLSGCGWLQPVQSPPVTTDLMPNVTEIIREAERAKKAAGSIRAEAPTAPPASAARIVAGTENVEDAANRIMQHAGDLGDKQIGINKLVAENATLNKALDQAKADSSKAAKKAQDWAWAIFAIVGGVGVAAAVALFFWGQVKIAWTVGAAAAGSLAVGVVLPVIISLTGLVLLIARIAIISVAVIAIGLLAWYIVVNRKAMLARIKQLTDGLRGVIVGMEASPPAVASVVKATIAEKAGPAGELAIRNVVTPLKIELATEGAKA